jgi:hypothetical protein
MAFGDADLGVFTADFGVAVVYEGQTANGILDTTTDMFMHGEGPGGFERSTVILRVPYNAFSSVPKPMDAITVGGVAYTVKELPEQRDMQITEMYLKPAS